MGGLAVRREELFRRYEKAIRETARFLNRELTEVEVGEILERVASRGRPKRTGYKPKEIERLERMNSLLESREAKSVTEAARRVAEDDWDHSESATFHWLRRHYKPYKGSKKSHARATKTEVRLTLAEIEKGARATGMRRR